MALKKALVTGGARRLGRAIALSLGQAGYDVAVHYHRSKDEADAVVAELQAMDVRAEAIQADLLSEAEVQTLVPRAVEALGGPLTLLVNNASVFEPDEIDTTTRDSWDRHFESNLRAPFVLIQALAGQAPDPIIDEAGHPIAQALVVNMIDQRVRRSGRRIRGSAG